MPHDDPNLSLEHFDLPDLDQFEPRRPSTHPPRTLLLYGSLRERSYSRFLTQEAARLLDRMGAETRIFDPRGCRCPTPSPRVTPRWPN